MDHSMHGPKSMAWHENILDHATPYHTGSMGASIFLMNWQEYIFRVQTSYKPFADSACSSFWGKPARPLTQSKPNISSQDGYGPKVLSVSRLKLGGVGMGWVTLVWNHLQPISSRPRDVAASQVILAEAVEIPCIMPSSSTTSKKTSSLDSAKALSSCDTPLLDLQRSDRLREALHSLLSSVDLSSLLPACKKLLRFLPAWSCSDSFSYVLVRNCSRLTLACLNGFLCSFSNSQTQIVRGIVSLHWVPCELFCCLL